MVYQVQNVKKQINIYGGSKARYEGQSWKYFLKEAINTPKKLAKSLGIEVQEITSVHQQYPLFINPYYRSLIRQKGDAIWRQCIPDVQELNNSGNEDPLNEEENSPVPNIVHRYPDRVLFYVSQQCSVYCRFCTRKRKIRNPRSISWDEIEPGINYIRQHPEIRDVIISGGDPLMNSDGKIEYILKKIRAIQHVEIIRIGTRMPVTLPQRITEDLCTILKRYHPLYLSTHFNHPDEITPESTKACSLLADAGIPLGNQSVLLKGVNDQPEIMKKLVQMLLSIRVKPYYIYLADLVKGTDHFRTSVQTGLDIIESLRGHTSGLGVPHLVIDSPGGGGKIAITANPIISFNKNEIVLKNYEGKTYSYPVQLVH